MADDINLMEFMDGGDWLGIVLATVASFFIGFLWFAPLFGKRWAREMGMEDMPAPGPKSMAWRMALNTFGGFLTAYVLWHVIVVFFPSVWAEHLGVAGIEDAPAYQYGLWGGFFVWLGFFLPVQFTKVAWENASCTLLMINTSHDLVRLLAMGVLVAVL